MKTAPLHHVYRPSNERANKQTSSRTTSSERIRDLSCLVGADPAVRSDETALAVLLAAGVQIEPGCQKGACSARVAEYVEGDVDNSDVCTPKDTVRLFCPSASPARTWIVVRSRMVRHGDTGRIALAYLEREIDCEEDAGTAEQALAQTVRRFILASYTNICLAWPRRNADDGFVREDQHKVQRKRCSESAPRQRGRQLPSTRCDRCQRPV